MLQLISDVFSHIGSTSGCGTLAAQRGSTDMVNTRIAQSTAPTVFIVFFIFFTPFLEAT